MSTDTNRDREAREILRGTADTRPREWRELALSLVNHSAGQVAPPLRAHLWSMLNQEAVSRCRALLEAVRSARAGGGA